MVTAFEGGVLPPRDAGQGHWLSGFYTARGAMRSATDLVAGVKTIIVPIEHNAKTAVRSSSLLTGKNVVDLTVTGLAVFQLNDDNLPFRLIELAPDVTADETPRRRPPNICANRAANTHGRFTHMPIS